jgi:membrane protease YdiL (CAAX protease family)
MALPNSVTGALTAPHVVFFATGLYLTYHLLIRPPVVARIFPAHANGDALRTRTAFFRRYLGTALFGLIPILALAVADADVNALGLHPFTSTHLALSLSPLALTPLLARQARNPSFRQHYPEVRTPFTNRTHALNALSWATYLLAYEFFFRGLLLLGLAPVIGPELALAVMVMGYVWVHLDKYPGEAIGSFVSGLGFGLLTLDSGSILPAFLAHLLIALLTDTLAAQKAAR